MIEVTKILDGGIDLRSGAQEPRSLVLEHNGVSTTMPISDDQLQVVLGLLHRAVAPEQPAPRPQETPRPAPRQPAPRPVPQPQPSDMEVGESYSDPETGVDAW